MTTYTCKCGKTFQKNTHASTTGNRMPDYDPEHECFGCPFVHEVKTWDPTQGTNVVDNHECRGCKETLFYDTVATCVDSKASTLHVKSLDFDFIQAMTDFYNTLDGVEVMGHAPLPGMDGAHGRLPFSFSFPQNLKGEAAKQKLIEHFFEPVDTGNSYSKMYVRKDISGCGEQYSLYRKIRDAKEEARTMNMPAEARPFTAVKYCKENRIYYVRPYQDKFRTFFCFLEDPSDETFLGSLPACDTPEIAQKMLDDYAQRNGFEGYTEATMEQDESGEAPEELDSSDDAENGDKSPEPANDESDSDNNSCDWSNASGGEDESSNSLPDGPDLSLRLPAFDSIFNAADDALRDMARTLKTKYIESGELNLKIVIDNYGGVLRPNSKKSKGDCALKPAKVSFPIRFSDDIEFTVDADGRVILPKDREHQMDFDEIQSGRVIAPVTTTVDGNTGLVENVDDGEDIPPEDSTPLFPCNNIDCPFYGFPDNGDAGCGFDPENDDDRNAHGDLLDAVTQYNCQRKEILDAYNVDTDFENSEEMLNDMPVEEFSEILANESTECSQFDCVFYSSDAQGHCVFDSKQSSYNAPNNYPADQDDVIESVEDYSCQKPELVAEYNKIKENEHHDEN